MQAAQKPKDEPTVKPEDFEKGSTGGDRYQKINVKFQPNLEEILTGPNSFVEDLLKEQKKKRKEQVKKGIQMFEDFATGKVGLDQAQLTLGISLVTIIAANHPAAQGIAFLAQKTFVPQFKAFLSSYAKLIEKYGELTEKMATKIASGDLQNNNDAQKAFIDEMTTELQGIQEEARAAAKALLPQLKVMKAFNYFS